MDIELYNKVFSNLYLKNEIYNYVREFNRQIVNSNLKNQSFKQVVKYDQVTFEWIIRNKEFELLKDKIKNNVKFQEFTYQSLISFTSSNPYDKELFVQFFKINRDVLVNSKIIDEWYREIDILTFSVYSKNTILFNLVIDDLTNKQGYTKNKLKELINSTFISSNLKISLFDVALECGNLDIIKYLYEEIGIVSLNNNKIILHSINSENRNQVVEYLLNKYFPETNFDQTTIVYNGIYDGYFKNLLKLQYGTLHKLLKLGTPLLFKQLSIPLPETISSTNKDDQIKFIEFFKSLLVIYSVEFNNISFLIILKKLNQLIDYNGIGNSDTTVNGSNNNVYSITKEDLITNKHHQQLQIDNNGIVNNIRSFLRNDVLSKTLNPIMYKDFNIIREIDRIYTFDFLKTIINNEISSSWIVKVLDFVVKYNEFNILDKLDQSSFHYLNHFDIIKISLENASTKILPIYSNFLKLENKSVLKNEKKLPLFNIKLPTSNLDKVKLFNLELVSISQQIQYLKSVVYNSDVIQCEKLLLRNILYHLFSNSTNLIKFSNQDFNEIGNIINYWKRITNSFPLEVWEIFNIGENGNTCNTTVNTIIYFYNNLPKELFNWVIDYSIMKSCNLELISYFYDNVPGFNKSPETLNNCKNLTIVKYLLDKYSISFKNGCLVYYSGLNDWKSGYLWYYTFNWLIENINSYDDPIKINVFELTINQIYFIHSKLIKLYGSPLFTSSKLILLDLNVQQQETTHLYFGGQFEHITSRPKEIITPSKLFTKTIYDINYIISHRNDNFIYSFIQSYENDTPSNQLLYNKIMNSDSIELLELSFNHSKLLNLLNNL